MAETELTINYALKLQVKCNFSDMKDGFSESAATIWSLLNNELTRERITETLRNMIDCGAYTVQIKDNEKKGSANLTKEMDEVVLDENDVAGLFKGQVKEMLDDAGIEHEEMK